MGVGTAGYAVFGKIVRNEAPMPQSQADVERLISTWFIEQHDAAPGETRIKDHAKKIWAELQKGSRINCKRFGLTTA